MSTLLNTRIRLRYDSYTNWYNTNPVLLEGEVAIAVPGTEFGNEGHKTSTAPCLMKVGNGTDHFNTLPWLSAVAADVHAWAKKSEAEFKTWLNETAEFATDAEVAAVASRVTTLEGDLNTASTGLKARVSTLESDLNTASTGLKARMTAVEGRATTLEGDVADLKALTGNGDGSLGKRVEALESDNTTNKSNISANATAIDNITKAETGAIAVAVKAEADRAKLAEEGLQTNLTNAIAKEVSDRDAAILVETNARVAAINGVNAAIEAEESRATLAEGGLSTRIKTIEDDYLKGADKTELQGNIDTLTGVVETLRDGVDAEKVDGIKDLIKYVEEHGPEVTGMKEDIADNASKITINANAIAKEITDRENADKAIGERIDGAEEALANYKAEIGFTKTDKTLMSVITDTYATKSELSEAVSGINSTASALEGRVKANEDKLAGLTKATVKAEIEAAQTAAEEKVTTLANGAVAANTAAIAAINHASTGILAQAKKYTDDEIDKVESAATLLGNRVTTNETLLAGIGGENQPANVVAAIAAAQTAAEQKVTDLANGQVKTNKLAIEAINHETTGILATAKGYTDTKVGEVSSALALEKQAREAFDAKTLTGVKDGDNLAISLNGDALGTLVFVCGGADID